MTINSLQKLTNKNLSDIILNCIFFVLFYLYLWFGVELHLIYHGGGFINNFPVFFRGWAFCRESIFHPGGIVEYLSAFLCQFFYYSWAGALIITLQAWLLCMCISYFLKSINAYRLRWVRFVPAVILLVVYNQYTFHFITTIALLVALVFVCLYLRITTGSKLSGTALATFLILSIVLYTAAAGAYLYFAALCAIYELFFRRRWQMGLLYLLSAPFICYIEGVLIFSVSTNNAFNSLLPFSWEVTSSQESSRMIILIHTIYLIPPLIALGLGFKRLFVGNHLSAHADTDMSEANYNKVEEKVEEKHHEPTKPVKGALSYYAGGPMSKLIIEPLALLMILGAAAFFSHDGKLKTLLEVDYYAHHKVWPEVLRTAHRFPNNYFITHAVNRALYHTGRLGHDMFSYPQNPISLLLTFKGSSFEFLDTVIYWSTFDTQIDLGLINMAEHALTESLATYGERPIILQRLALVNMVKGNTGAAQVYLGALSKTLFHSGWANKYRDLLKSDPNLLTDKEIQRLRSLMPEKDHILDVVGIDNLLSFLLEKNKHNRMAFEYKMSNYLLTKQLEKFVQNLDRLNDFDYPEIHRAYQEAILFYMVVTKKTVNLYGRRISPETHNRIIGFNNIYRRYRGNEQLAIPKLAENYGDSYFFYYLYGYQVGRE